MLLISRGLRLNLDNRYYHAGSDLNIAFIIQVVPIDSHQPVCLSLRFAHAVMLLCLVVPEDALVIMLNDEFRHLFIAPFCGLTLADGSIHHSRE